MKVSEYIKILQTMDQDAIVIKHSDNFEMNRVLVNADIPMQFNSASETTENFRDAFDGNIYQSKIWNINSGDKKVILI